LLKADPASDGQLLLADTNRSPPLTQGQAENAVECRIWSVHNVIVALVVRSVARKFTQRPTQRIRLIRRST